MAVATIAANSMYVKPLWGGVKSFFHNYSSLVFGVEQSNVFAEEMQKSIRGTKNMATKKYEGGTGYNGLGEKFKNAWVKSKEVVKDKSFLDIIKDSFKGIIPEAKEALNATKVLGRDGKIWGTLKVLGKRMPFLGNLLGIALSVPNIYQAFTDTKNGGGVQAGLTEIGKEAIKAGTGIAGFLIGQALIPIPLIGGVIGVCLFSMLTDKIVGDSFTKNAAEKEAAEAKTAKDSTTEASNASGQGQSQWQQGSVNQNGLYLPPITAADTPTYNQKRYSNPFAYSSI